MKEWASVPASASRRWKGLVEEARVFVGGAEAEGRMLRYVRGSSA